MSVFLNNIALYVFMPFFLFVYTLLHVSPISTEVLINPLTPRSDQHIKSPYNFNTLSSREVLRIQKVIN